MSDRDHPLFGKQVYIWRDDLPGGLPPRTVMADGDRLVIGAGDHERLAALPPKEAADLFSTFHRAWFEIWAPSPLPQPPESA